MSHLQLCSCIQNKLKTVGTVCWVTSLFCSNLQTPSSYCISVHFRNNVLHIFASVCLFYSLVQICIPISGESLNPVKMPALLLTGTSRQQENHLLFFLQPSNTLRRHLCSNLIRTINTEDLARRTSLNCSETKCENLELCKAY